MTTVDPNSLPLEEQVERWKNLAETMLEDAKRFKAERDELLEKLPLLHLAEQFMVTFLAFQQQIAQQHPEGYHVHIPGVPGGVTLSTSTSGRGSNDDHR